MIEAVRVLLVDDDEETLVSLRRHLRSRYRVDTALGGQEALEVMKAKGPHAVVVSDYAMPGMDGVEFFRQVRRRHPDTIRIMLTGFNDLQTAVLSVNEAQVFRFLAKPCAAPVLMEAVEQAAQFYAFSLHQRQVAGLERWRRSLEQIVVALVNLVETRDPYTAGHQQRVAKLARAIGAAMGMGGDAIDSLVLAAHVHDVGKVYVPFEFLNKPGTLSELEFNIIRCHPQVGYEILSPVEFAAPVPEMVLQHHERLDGSGYPRGLTGDDILPEARIIAVADVVEAMSSDRPYRPKVGLGPALAEIEANAGARYDPGVVEACLRLFREGRYSLDQ